MCVSRLDLPVVFGAASPGPPGPGPADALWVIRQTRRADYTNDVMRTVGLFGFLFLCVFERSPDREAVDDDGRGFVGKNGSGGRDITVKISLKNNKTRGQISSNPPAVKRR